MITEFQGVIMSFHDLLFTGSSGSRLQKAQAESFIHIFVNNSAKLTEFLEHMISVSFIEDLIQVVISYEINQMSFWRV